MPFEAIKIAQNVFWVGAIDWELRDFHGYHTGNGTTYNAYLILGDAPILIDTVKLAFCNEMLERITSVIDPKKIKYIISNHSEMDHSGSIPELIKLINPEKVFASKIGVQTLKEHFHLDYPFSAVNNGENLQLGNSNFTFFDTKMLHWPESMFTYYHNEKILFSQDGFSLHLATAKIFADENNADLVYSEAKKYYANILLPYSPLVQKLIENPTIKNLAIDLLATAHGPIWRNDGILQIINNWHRWSKQNYYPKAVIIYDTMWNSTKQMAHNIADGLAKQNIAVKIFPAAISHRSDVVTEILEAGALILGSPTLNQEIMPSLSDHICYIRGLKPKNLIGQSFGSYGWGNEANKILQAEMAKMQIELIDQPVNCKYVPTNDILMQCRNLGEKIGIVLNEKVQSQPK